MPSNPTPTEAEAARLVAQLEVVRRVSAQARADLAGGTTNRSARSGVHVTHEPRTYRSGGEHSFFADAWSTAASSGLYSAPAEERLRRHHQESVREGEVTARAQSTGAAGGLVVPQYLLSEAALVARQGRTAANIVRHQDIPEQGMSIVLPRGTGGATAASQAMENSTVSNTDETWQTLTIPVATIAGQADVSRQLLERGGSATTGVDQVIFGDLAAAYAAELDRQIVNGTGTSGQLTGILTQAGTTQEPAFTTAITVAKFMSAVAKAQADVLSARYMAADAIVLHPRRWAWLVSQTDTAGRPLVVPAGNGPMNVAGLMSDPAGNDLTATGPGVTRPVGWLLGVPVFVDANVPTNLGTAAEDVVTVLRTADAVLWETPDGQPQQIRFDQMGASTATVSLQVYGYTAFTCGRYPASIAKIGGNATAGNGLITPTW